MGNVLTLFLKLSLVEMAKIKVIRYVFLLVWLLGELGKDALMRCIVLLFFLLMFVVLKADD